MRFFFDTEFIEDGRTVELLSIGVVAQDGRTYYAEPLETDRSRASKWVVENVIPGLTGPVLKRADIAQEIQAFVGVKPEFWAYYADYDWVALCQLYGTMMQLPPTWPMFCLDFKQMLLERGDPRMDMDGGHNALQDAIKLRDAFNELAVNAPGISP